MLLIKNIKVFYKDRLNFWLINAAVLFILAGWLLLLFRPIVRSDLSILHYNIYFGFDAIGPWYWLYLLPAISLVISILDLALAYWLWNKQTIWSHFIITAVAVINFMVLIYLYNIISYNL